MPAMMPLKNIESSYSGKSPLKREGSKIYGDYHASLLRPEERVRLLDQLNDKPLSFYRKKREAIYVSDLLHKVSDFNPKSRSESKLVMQNEFINLFFQDFNNFYSSDEIILPLPTPNRLNLLRYEMHPIGKKYTDKPNTLAIFVFGFTEALLIDRIGGFFHFVGIPKDLQCLNLEIAKDMNHWLIHVGREIDVLSMRYRPHPFSEVYDDNTVISEVYDDNTVLT